MYESPTTRIARQTIVALAEQGLHISDVEHVIMAMRRLIEEQKVSIPSPLLPP